MTNSLKIIHIEDIASDAELVDRTLKKSGISFEKIIVDTRAEYIKALEDFDADIILSDHSLPAFNSLEALNILKGTGKLIPFILITSTVSEEFAVSVMKEGASDYVLKDRLQRLPSAVINAIEKHQSDTERQNYLSKIVASEALFSKAELIAEFGTWTIDLATNITTWSAGTFNLLGYKYNEVEPSMEAFFKNIHEEDVDEVESSFRQAIDDIQPANAEYRVLYQDGVVRYLRSQFEFELDGAGNPISIIGFTQDVTPSRLAQIEIEKNLAELQAAAARQTSILNALPPNIVLLNEAGKIVAVNESWRKFTLKNNLGIPKYGIDYSYTAISEKATGVDEISAKKIAKGIRDIITGDIGEFSMEYSFYSGHEKVWYQIIVAPLTDKTKKGAVVLHTDITPRKLAEELMLQSEANLQTIFENTEVAYVLCNTENKIVSFNSKAAELCHEQFNKKLRVGVGAFSYFPKNKIPNLKESVQKVSHNEMVSYETSYQSEDGATKWYEAQWAGVANDKKENIGFILSFKDISERKIADIERDRMTTDLVQRYKDLEQFTYIVSHNLRAPVANIIGLSNILNAADSDSGENKEVLTALTQSINVLDQTVMDLNHILQVHSNINEKSETVRLQALLDEVITNQNALIKNENAVITTNFTAGGSVVGIKSYLYSIFYNLVNNSIKYKQPGVDPVISVTSKKKGDKLLVLFKDNGRGIDEKNFKNLFGLYKRFDTSVEGKGIGLFMVKMQIENLGGKIIVHSEPGKGTTFEMEFPQN